MQHLLILDKSAEGNKGKQQQNSYKLITNQLLIKMAQQNFKLGFAENFMLSGAAAAISKTAAAPIERVKLLVQNQNEMIKQGTLSEPYKGVIDCTVRTFKTEGKQFFAYFKE